MMILRLKDGTEINNVTSETTATAIVVEVANMEELETIQTAIGTKGNLDRFEFIENDNVIGVYEHYKYLSTTYAPDDEGCYNASFFIAEKSDVEIRLDALEAGQELQNGAIDELAEIVGGE